MVMQTYLYECLDDRDFGFIDRGNAELEQFSQMHVRPLQTRGWLCRMLDGGADPLYIGRRIIRMAVEDIGLADPRALRMTLDACETYERLGSHEGELFRLAQAVLCLCLRT